MRPEVGDKITAIDGDQVLCGAVVVANAALEAPYKNIDGFYWMPERADLRAVIPARFETEGVTWIRGWYTSNTDDVKAMLAARKLRASASLQSVAWATCSTGTYRVITALNPAFDFDPLR